MGAAFSGRDVVDIGKQGFRIGIGKLNGSLHHQVVARALQQNNAIVQNCLVSVEKGNIINDTAFILEDFGLIVGRCGALVCEADSDTAVQVGQLAQTPLYQFAIESGFFKNVVIR